MNKYKTFEELKEELGDKFEEYMYKANIELLKKLDKIKEYIEHEIFKRNILLGISEKKYTRDILNHILEMIEETK